MSPCVNTSIDRAGREELKSSNYTDQLPRQIERGSCSSNLSYSPLRTSSNNASSVKIGGVNSTIDTKPATSCANIVVEPPTIRAVGGARLVGRGPVADRLSYDT